MVVVTDIGQSEVTAYLTIQVVYLEATAGTQSTIKALEHIFIKCVDTCPLSIVPVLELAVDTHGSKTSDKRLNAENVIDLDVVFDDQWHLQVIQMIAVV